MAFYTGTYYNIIIKGVGGCEGNGVGKQFGERFCKQFGKRFDEQYCNQWS